MTTNKPQKNLRPHTTHYACDERLKEYGGKTLGCCCTGHKCKQDVDKSKDIESEIREILEELYDTAERHNGYFTPKVKKEANTKLLQLLQDAEREARIDEDETWRQVFDSTQEIYRQKGMDDSYIYFTGLNKAFDNRLTELKGEDNDL